MRDLINRQDAITLPVLPVEHRKYQTENIDDAYELGWVDCQKCIEELPSSQPERLTDKEQRIFLAAMQREEKVCKQVDEECRDCRKTYEDSLVSVCREVKRKVKGVLWA